MEKHRSKQKGFTLIELIIVIVIVAILAAVAIPKFLDLQSDAKQAAVDGVAGALGSASAANYAIRSGISSKGTAVTTCAGIGALLSPPLDTGKFVMGGSSIGTANGSTGACSITYSGGTQVASFIGHYIS